MPLPCAPHRPTNSAVPRERAREARSAASGRSTASIVARYPAGRRSRASSASIQSAAPVATVTPPDRAAAGREERLEILRDAHAHRGAGLERRAAQVRQQHRVLQRDQARMHGRLPLVDVETGGGDAPGPQRLDQRGLVDHRAARGVDQHRRRLHQREPAGVDQVMGGGATRAVQRDHVACGEQCIDRIDVLRAAFGLDSAAAAAPAVVDDAHAESVVGAARRGLRDAPVADQSERLAGDALAHQVRGAPAGPASRRAVRARPRQRAASPSAAAGSRDRPSCR